MEEASPVAGQPAAAKKKAEAVVATSRPGEALPFPTPSWGAYAIGGGVTMLVLLCGIGMNANRKD